MALRTIRVEGDPVLGKVCREVTEVTPKIVTLIDDMLETMYEANGVGLAAPQVGILKRIVVIDVGEGPIVMINPEIIESDGEQTGDEGCLSVPGKAGQVTRPNYVKARFMGEDMNEYEIEGEGVGAQGIYLVKVTVIQKKSKLDVDVIKKCAVHGVLFKGFSSQTSRTRQKPLAGSMVVEQQHQDYFDVFFQKGGSYMNFANMVGENLSVVKMGKQYRISAVVSVAKDALYQELVSAGVIKGLNNGF